MLPRKTQIYSYRKCKSNPPCCSSEEFCLMVDKITTTAKVLPPVAEKRHQSFFLGMIKCLCEKKKILIIQRFDEKNKSIPKKIEKRNSSDMP